MQQCLMGGADRLLAGNAQMSDFENAPTSKHWNKLDQTREFLISLFSKKITYSFVKVYYSDGPH